MKEMDGYKEAQDYVNKLAAFYQHLAAYLLVNGGLFIFNVSTDQNWFLYPLLGWGIGLAAHAADVLVLSRIGADWKRKKVEQYLKNNRY